MTDTYQHWSYQPRQPCKCRVSPLGELLSGKLYETNRFFLISKLAPSSALLCLKGRFIVSVTSSKQGLPPTWVQGPILWTRPCCHWSLTLIHLIHAWLLSRVYKAPTSTARGLVHDLKDRVLLAPQSQPFYPAWTSCVEKATTTWSYPCLCQEMQE